MLINVEFFFRISIRMLFYILSGDILGAVVLMNVIFNHPLPLIGHLKFTKHCDLRD